METKWIQPSAEPTLRELMSDPIVLLLMRRDGVTPADLWTEIERLRRRQWRQNLARRTFVSGSSPEADRSLQGGSNRNVMLEESQLAPSRTGRS